jgi:hypothetical protein
MTSATRTHSNAITPQEALQRVIEHREIFHDEMLHIMRLIMSGEMPPVLMAAFIAALRVKKETIGEITAAAQVMREFSTKVDVADRTHMVDIVGTGGDGSHTFNISTASMFVAAAAGAIRLAPPASRHKSCVRRKSAYGDDARSVESVATDGGYVSGDGRLVASASASTQRTDGVSHATRARMSTNGATDGERRVRDSRNGTNGRVEGRAMREGYCKNRTTLAFGFLILPFRRTSQCLLPPSMARVACRSP